MVPLSEDREKKNLTPPGGGERRRISIKSSSSRADVRWGREGGGGFFSGTKKKEEEKGKLGPDPLYPQAQKRKGRANPSLGTRKRGRDSIVEGSPTLSKQRKEA